MALLVVVLLIAAGPLLLARLLDTLGGGRAPSPIPQLAAFAPWAVPVWALLVVIGAAAGAGALVVVAAGALAVQVIWAVPPGRRAADPDTGQVLTLVTVNALVGRADPAAVLALVRDGADVLVVQELTGELAAALDPAVRGAGLPHADLHPAEHGAGTGIWSRWPAAPLGLLPTSRCAMPQVRLQPPRSLPVTLTGVHTQSPDPRRIAGWRTDLATLARVAAAAGPGPQVFAGDFNASRDHAGFRQLLTAGLDDAADITGRRPGLTWPGHLLPFADLRSPALTRLDHVLVSRDVGVSAVRTVRIPGTDHLAVVARLHLPVLGD